MSKSACPAVRQLPGRSLSFHLHIHAHLHFHLHVRIHIHIHFHFHIHVHGHLHIQLRIHLNTLLYVYLGLDVDERLLFHILLLPIHRHGLLPAVNHVTYHVARNDDISLSDHDPFLS
jgi:hypothetical protein